MVKAAVERPEQDRNSRQKSTVLIPQAARRAAVLGTPKPWPRGSAGWSPAAGGPAEHWGTGVPVGSGHNVMCMTGFAVKAVGAQILRCTAIIEPGEYNKP